MNYIVHEHHGVIEMVIEGNILQENVENLRCRFSDLIENGKVNIVLNMEQSNYISSLSLALIVDTKKKLTALKGDLKIAKVNRLIQNLLEITNLIKKLEVYTSIEDAVASFGSKIGNSG